MSTSSNDDHPSRRDDDDDDDSLGHRFQAFQRHPALADLNLVGDDGIPVPAVRYVLACSSPVLECMLYGSFSEAQHKDSSLPVINLHIDNYDPPCRSQALQALVHYCCTNQIISNNGKKADEYIMDLVTLAHLGHQYQLAGRLEAKILAQLQPLLQPAVACWVLQHTDEVTTPELHRDSLETVLQHPQETLVATTTTEFPGMRCGIQGLSADQVEVILSQVEMTAGTQQFYFQRLLEWKQANDNLPEHFDEISNREPDQTGSSLDQVCRDWVQRYFQLAWMDPVQDLPAMMAGSLVDPQQLVKALLEQAQLATCFGMNYAACRDANGKPQCHVRVQGAARDEMNGLYVEVKDPPQQSPPQARSNSSSSPNQRRFCKLKEPENVLEPRFFIHVDIHHTNGSHQWRMCDDYFPCYTVTTTAKQPYPSQGWKGHFCGPEHAPTCQWYIPKDTVLSSTTTMHTISLDG